jgi:sec-independent protein translocase protein TatA
MGALQPGHLLVILAIVVLIFGPGKLGDLGKALGEGIRELKKGVDPGDHSGSASTAVVTRPCPSCNTPVANADKFCGVCGANVPSTNL